MYQGTDRRSGAERRYRQLRLGQRRKSTAAVSIDRRAGAERRTDERRGAPDRRT